MIVGCYSIDLYCDSPSHEKPMYLDPSGPDQFTGQTERECVAQARARGWKIRLCDQKAICPKCAKKGVKA